MTAACAPKLSHTCDDGDNDDDDDGDDRLVTYCNDDDVHNDALFDPQMEISTY